LILTLLLLLPLLQPASVDPSQANLLCCGSVMQAELIHSVANREETAFQIGRSILLKVSTGVNR
jgi:hypothetical protein